MLRFAPSSTEDLHVQSLRVALFNYIISVQTKKDLLIRIEDIDKENNVEGKDNEIIGLLDLFGIKYSHVVYQSANIKYHRTMALSLLHEKIAFNCFCTPETLKAKKEEASKNNKVYSYDEACLTLSPEQTIDNENSFTVRLRKPNVDVEFTDSIQGKTSFPPVDIDSYIILDANKMPTYNFACAVDDMLANVTMVVRSENHLVDTPKQIAARAALNYTTQVTYAHIPILLNSSGDKMCEVDEGNSVKWLLEEGFLPVAIINYLLLLGNKTPTELFSLEEALKWFDITKTSTEPVAFNMEELRLINKKQLMSLDDVELSRYVGFADADIGKLAKLYLEEVSTTKELKIKIGAIFSEKIIPDDIKEATSVIKPIIQNAPYCESFDGFKSYIIKKSGLNEDLFDRPLRFLLTGMSEGPALEAMYPFLKNYMPEIVK